MRLSAKTLWVAGSWVFVLGLVCLGVLAPDNAVPLRGDPKPAPEKSAVQVAYDALQEARKREAAAVKSLDAAQRGLQTASTSLTEAVDRADKELFSLVDGEDGLTQQAREVESLYARKFELAARAELLNLNGQSLADARRQWDQLARYRGYFADGTFDRLEASIRFMQAEVAALRRQENLLDQEIASLMRTYEKRVEEFDAAAARGLNMEDLERPLMAAMVTLGNAQTELVEARKSLTAAVLEYLLHTRDNMPPYLQRIHIKSGGRTLYQAEWVRRFGDDSLENYGPADERLADEVDRELASEQATYQAHYDELVALLEAELAWYREYEPRMIARTKRINELASSVGNWAMAKVVAPLLVEILATGAEVLTSGGTATAARHAAAAVAEAGVRRLEATATRSAASAVGDGLFESGENIVERCAREWLERYSQTLGEARRRYAAKLLGDEWDQLGARVQAVHRMHPKMHESWISSVVERANLTFDSDVRLMQGIVTAEKRRAIVDRARRRTVDSMQRAWGALLSRNTEREAALGKLAAGKFSGVVVGQLLEKTLITGSAGALETGLLSAAGDAAEIGTGAGITAIRKKATEAVARVADGTGRYAVRSFARPSRLSGVLSYRGGVDLSKVKLVQVRDIGVGALKAALAAYFAHKQESAEREMMEALIDATADAELYFLSTIQRLQIGLDLASLGQEIGYCIGARQYIRAPNQLRVIHDDQLDDFPANLTIELSFSNYVRSATVRVGSVVAPMVTEPGPDGTMEWRAAIALPQSPGGARLPVEVTATDTMGRVLDGDPLTSCMLDMQMIVQGHDRKPDTRHSVRLGVFGDTRVRGKWRATVYRSDVALKGLPDISKLVPITTFETDTLNIPSREADGGFPGVPANLKLVENYAIAFEGTLEVPRDMRYRFHLISDDGSKLWVNEQLVVDNDRGAGHATQSGELSLAPGQHALKVRYYQGSKPKIALQFLVEEKGVAVPEARIRATPYVPVAPTVAFVPDAKGLDDAKGRLYLRFLGPGNAPLETCNVSVTRASDGKEVSYGFSGSYYTDLAPGEYVASFQVHAVKIERKVTVTAGAVVTAQAGGSAEVAYLDFNFRTVAGDLPWRGIRVVNAADGKPVYGGLESGERLMPPGVYDIEADLSYGNGTGRPVIRAVKLDAGQCIRLEYGPVGRAQWVVTGARTSSGCRVAFYRRGSIVETFGGWTEAQGWRDLPAGVYDVWVHYLEPAPFWIRGVHIREGETTDLDLRR